MGIGSLLKLGGRALKCVPEFIFGDSAHIIGKAYKAAPKGSIWSKAKVAGKAFEKHVDKLHVAKGGFLKRLWKNTVGLPKALNTSRKAGVRLAKMRGTSAFMGGLKGIGKGIAKKMPYIGAALTVAFEIPNIVKGYKKDGVKGALKQCAGAATELGCMATGAAVGSCFGPVGTLVGGLVGGIVGMFVRSKVAPEPAEEEVPTESNDLDHNLEQTDSSSEQSSSTLDHNLEPSSSSSGTESSSSSTGSSGSTDSTSTTTNPVGTTNPFGIGLNLPNPVSIGMNPIGLGNPIGTGMYNPFGGLTGTGMNYSPIDTFTNSLLQPGENIFLKYPIGYRFQYLGQ